MTDAARPTASVNSEDPDNLPIAELSGSPIPIWDRKLAPRQMLTVIGCCCVVLGGLVAAVTGPLGWVHGSWLAAYLVLVGGVAQYAMGRVQTREPEGARPRNWGWAQIGAWNLGNAAVISGTLTGEPLAIDLGSMLLVLALAVALHDARRAARWASPLFRWAYRMLLLVVAGSIPVGALLSHLRHS